MFITEQNYSTDPQDRLTILLYIFIYTYNRYSHPQSLGAATIIMSWAHSLKTNHSPATAPRSSAQVLFIFDQALVIVVCLIVGRVNIFLFVCIGRNRGMCQIITTRETGAPAESYFKWKRISSMSGRHAKMHGFRVRACVAHKEECEATSETGGHLSWKVIGEKFRFSNWYIVYISCLPRCMWFINWCLENHKINRLDQERVNNGAGWIEFKGIFGYISELAKHYIF